jgi:hypothetical protein
MLKYQSLATSVVLLQRSSLLLCEACRHLCPMYSRIGLDYSSQWLSSCLEQSCQMQSVCCFQLVISTLFLKSKWRTALHELSSPYAQKMHIKAPAYLRNYFLFHESTQGSDENLLSDFHWGRVWASLGQSLCSGDETIRTEENTFSQQGLAPDVECNDHSEWQ